MGKLKSRTSEGSKIKAPSSAADSSSTQSMQVRFSFKHFEHDCVSACTLDELGAFTKTMGKLSDMTWQQVTQAPRHGLGHERISDEQLQCPRPKHLGLDHLLAFRFDGKKPMLGFREGATFHVVWLDRDFSAYDHG